MRQIKNKIANRHGTVDCEIFIGGFWHPHTIDPSVTYEIHKDSQWRDVKPAPEGAVEAELAKSGKAEAVGYLTKTDWYALRLLETGNPIPPNIAKKRAKARLEAG